MSGKHASNKDAAISVGYSKKSATQVVSRITNNHEFIEALESAKREQLVRQTDKATEAGGAKRPPTYAEAVMALRGDGARIQAMLRGKIADLERLPSDERDGLLLGQLMKLYNDAATQTAKLKQAEPDDDGETGGSLAGIYRGLRYGFAWGAHVAINGGDAAVQAALDIPLTTAGNVEGHIYTFLMFDGCESTWTGDETGPRTRVVHDRDRPWTFEVRKPFPGEDDADPPRPVTGSEYEPGKYRPLGTQPADTDDTDDQDGADA